MHKADIDSQYIVSMKNHLHPNTLRALNFWSTTMHVIWAMNDVALSCSSTFGRQSMAYRSIHQCSIYIGRHPHRFSSSSFPSICMTYHKQFPKSRPCAPGLNRELCTWMHGWMQHDGRRSCSSSLHIDRSFYELYDIMEFNFVNKFCL